RFLSSRKPRPHPRRPKAAQVLTFPFILPENTLRGSGGAKPPPLAKALNAGPDVKAPSAFRLLCFCFCALARGRGRRCRAGIFIHEFQQQGPNIVAPAFAREDPIMAGARLEMCALLRF